MINSLVDHTAAIDVLQYCEDITFEAALLKITLKKPNLHILGTYRSPDGQLEGGLSAFSELIEDSKIENAPLIIMGDINVDFLTGKTRC